MASLSGLLEVAVYNIAAADSTLLTSVGGRMKHGLPTTGWIAPYILYSFPNLPGTNTYKTSSPRTFSISIYFDIFSKEDFFSTEVGTIASNLRSVFDGATLSLTGFNDTIIKLVAERPLEQEDTGLWHLQMRYSGMACAS